MTEPIGVVWRLPPDVVGRLARHLRDHHWGWTVDGLAEALAGIGWEILEREPDEVVLWLACREYPELSGLAYPIEPSGEILNVVLGVTGSADELDADCQANLDAAADWFAATLPGVLGLPDYHNGRWPVWSGAVCDVSLQRNTVEVAVAAVHRSNLARIRGEPIADGLTHSERTPATSGNVEWEALASGLGRLLRALADLEFVSLALDDVVVLRIGRDGGDAWLVAIGLQDQVAPVKLSADQEATLTAIGFRPPMGDELPEPGPQRDNWWFHLRLPADPLLLESAGHLLIAAARQVYGADRPSAIVWFGMGLGTSTIRVLDSLELTRSKFQRG